MSKRLQIERALWEIDGATFQRLGDAYLRRRGYRHINPLGLAFGRVKTTTGTPDTLVVRDDGRFVFVEYTTQEAGVAGKFLDDLKKCFDEQVTGVPVNRIAEIILCHNRKLSAKDELTLRQECENRGVALTTVGLGELAADLVERYPQIASELLGIDVDTGQILLPEDFVRLYGQSALATPLDTAFLSREPELASVATALETSRVVVLSGRPGTGKSRLALETAARYQLTHPGAQVWCILNRGLDLSAELRAAFTPSGHYVLVVDDANRLSSFPYVLDLLRDDREDRTLKIVATVRDYALEQVLVAAADFGVAPPIEVGPMTREEIHALVAEQYAVRHPLYLERIDAIAEGNPRLALMAARVANEQQSLAALDDATALYDEYFRSVRRELTALDEPSMTRAAGLVAFFRQVDRTHQEQIGVIADTLGLAPKEFWEAVRQLHELELVDLYEDEAAKISDQVLATYLFYLAVFRDRTLDLSTLLVTFFPRFRHRFIDALNPVLATFGVPALLPYLRASVLTAHDVFLQRGDHEAVQSLLEAFAVFVPDRALSEAHRQIEAISAEAMPASLTFVASSNPADTDMVLSLLGRFSHAEIADRAIALELLVEYVTKRPTAAPHAVHVLQQAYGVDVNSYAEGFVVQQHVADLLRIVVTARATSAADAMVHRTAGDAFKIGVGLFLGFAVDMLKTQFQRTRPGRGHVIHITRFHLPETTELRVLRNGLWDTLLTLLRDHRVRADVLHAVSAYLSNGLDRDSREVVAADLAHLLPNLVNELSPAAPAEVVALHGLQALADRLDIALDSALWVPFADQLDFYEVLTGGRLEERVADPDLFDRAREAALTELADREAADEFRGLLDRVEQWIPAIPQHYQWRVTETVAAVLRRGVRANPSIFSSVIVPRLRAGTAVDLNVHGIVASLIEALGAEGGLDTLEGDDFPRRPFWMLSYCARLVEGQIHTRQRELLRSTYASAAPGDLLRLVDHLQTFDRVFPGTSLDIARILAARHSVDPQFGPIFASFFRSWGNGKMCVAESFGTDAVLATQLYLFAAASEPHFDFDARAFDELLTLDPSFGATWVRWQLLEGTWKSFHDESRDYSRLWLRPDAAAVFDAILDAIQMTQPPRMTLDPYLVTFFRIPRGKEQAPEVATHQDSWLTTLIQRRCHDAEGIRLLFSVVSELPDERRRGHIETFLGCNSDIALFQSLRLEPRGRSWSGSAVPMYEREVAFYRSLLPFCNRIALLPHRRLLQQRIEQIEAEIIREKKRDFMED
jgi:hypothetical protein